jgi:putative ABC transport system substrate-binding protein
VTTRRTLITLIGGAAVWPLTARAQQTNRVVRIGVLMGSLATGPTRASLAAFLERLEALGWREGGSANIEVRWWNGDPKTMRNGAEELLALSPDVVMVFTNLALSAIMPILGKVPAVFVAVGDPVGGGFVASLARPGGNVTGFTSFEPSMGGKWLAILKEAAPHVNRALVILHPETAVHQAFWHSAEEAAHRLGMEAIPGAVHDPSEVESVFASFAARSNGGIIALPHAITEVHRELIIDLELRHRLPAVHWLAYHAIGGALVSYGFDAPYVFRQTADYVDRVLKGVKPADLPVQAPTKFQLVINLNTAKMLGLEVSPMLLARADEVIE